MTNIAINQLISAQAIGYSDAQLTRLGPKRIGLNGGDLPIVVDTPTDLATLQAPSGQIAQTRGRLTAGDGAGWDYYYDSLSGSTVNGGTVFAAYGGTGRWLAIKPKHLVDSRFWGAKGDGIQDDGTAIAAALSAIDICYLSPGTYKITTTLSVGTGKYLYGDGRKSVLAPSSVTGAAISITGTEPKVENLFVNGTATKAVLVNGAQHGVLRNVQIFGTYTDGFVLRECWAWEFANLWTNGATISGNCFVCGYDFNANQCTNWYTSNVDCAVNVLINSAYEGSGGAQGHGNNFAMICCQGGTKGLWIVNGYGLSFNGIYSENVVTPLWLGDQPNGRYPRAIAINGIDLAGPYGSHSNYASRVAAIEAEYCKAVTITGATFEGCYLCGNAAPITPSGDGSGAILKGRVKADGTLGSVSIQYGGTGYTTATAAVGGAGSGATVSVTVSGGAIATATVTAAGTGYTTTSLPVAIRYHNSVDLVLVAPAINSGVGITSTFWPWIVRKSGAASSAGITIVQDQGKKNEANTAYIGRTQGYGYKHYVEEVTSAGAKEIVTFDPGLH